MRVAAPMHLQYSAPALRPQFGFAECPMDHLGFEVVCDPEIVDVAAPVEMMAADAVDAVVVVIDALNLVNCSRRQVLETVSEIQIDSNSVNSA